MQFFGEKQIRFLLVGGTATAIQYTLLLVLVEAFDRNPVTSSAIGFSVAAVVNYLLNKHFTFRSTSPHGRSAPRFAAMALFGTLLTSLCMKAFVALGVHYVVSQIFTTAIVLVSNYLIAAHWVYRDAAIRGADT